MKEPREIAFEVSDMLNSFGDKNSKEFVSVILNDHPTLQQRFMSEIVIRFIYEISKKREACFDGRNKMTYDVCRQLVEMLKQSGVENGLPTI